MVDTEKHFATRLSVIFKIFPFRLKELAVCIFDLKIFKDLITPGAHRLRVENSVPVLKSRNQ